MAGETDPDWFFDHVLFYAQQGVGAVITVDEVKRWQAWWRAQARGVQDEWPELAQIALRQGFSLTSAQLQQGDVGRPRARGLVKRGRWKSPVRGAVTVVGEAAITADQPDRWTADRRRHALGTAAAVATNAGHVVTGESAAVLHGLPVFVLPASPELTVPPGRVVRRKGAKVADLPSTDIAHWFGVPLTTAQRTVIDVARCGRRPGIVVADAALRTGLVTRAQLDAALIHAAGWPGVVQSREIVRLADPHAESPLESILRLAVHDSGLPAPELQRELHVPGRRASYRVDMLWQQQRLIVEADGRVKYAATGDRRDGDPLWAEKKREIALRRLGYRVERIIWSDVVATWDATYALLAEALG